MAPRGSNVDKNHVDKASNSILSLLLHLLRPLTGSLDSKYFSEDLNSILRVLEAILGIIIHLEVQSIFFWSSRCCLTLLSTFLLDGSGRSFVLDGFLKSHHLFGWLSHLADFSHKPIVITAVLAKIGSKISVTKRKLGWAMIITVRARLRSLCLTHTNHRSGRCVCTSSEEA